MLRKIFLPLAKSHVDLENRWWHRLIKIVYIFIVGFILCYFIWKTLDQNSLLLSQNLWLVIYGFLASLIVAYVTSIILQFLYYKVILYIIFGKK